ncbi:MAG TPA: hypothetical protein GX400_10770 [Chloroflexi bacterium]|nr:hypothetical protein [Chloroflexota bacterium]
MSGCSAGVNNAISAVTPLPPTADAPTAPTQPPTSTASAAQETAPTATPAPTPTPLDLNLPAGSALASARATDIATRPTPRNPMSFDEFPVKLRFDEFYDGYNVRTGLILSDKLLSLDGQPVVIEGYMAPPLKAELDWFVLTRIQLAYCPFCSTAADWPDDIALVYLADSTMRPTDRPMRLYGTLEVGPSIDPETGMLSLVRIYADKLELL